MASCRELLPPGCCTLYIHWRDNVEEEENGVEDRPGVSEVAQVMSAAAASCSLMSLHRSLER